MKGNSFKNLAFVVAVVLFSVQNGFSAGTFVRLMVEYVENPTNISEKHPRFSWIFQSSERNRQQSSFRILVANQRDLLSQNRGNCWDSGVVNSWETTQHEYRGAELQPDHTYFWKVILRDNKGQVYESPIARFETALFSQGEWKAQWIGKPSGNEILPEKGFYGSVKEQSAYGDTIVHNGRSLLLRKEIRLNKKVSSAKAFVSGVGFYEFYVNGNRVGDFVLNPAKTPYHKHILYDTYDVTKFLKQGENVVGFHLGNGWYNPYKKWWKQYRMQWFGHKKAIAQIRITFDDGTSTVIYSDQTWKQSDGPVLCNCVYDGEIYDANQQQPGWNQPGFDDSVWKPVSVFSSVKAQLIAQQIPPIRVIQTIRPTELKPVEPNQRVFDMGQNFTGWAQIEVKGAPQTRIKIRYAEDIFPDGRIDATSNENARATAEYVLKGSEFESYEPLFTYFGFRYVEITSNQPFELRQVTGKVIHSDNRPIGAFECGNDLVYKIHRATVWSQKSNMLGYPMDCPQRDERLGWLGDAQVSAEQASFNFDMALFYRNWFAGIRANQNEQTGDLPIISPQPYMPDEGIEWSSTYLIMLWQYYLNYGDKRILHEHYPAMKRYMDFLAGLAKGHILPMGWIGDWGSLVKGWKEGQPESVPTAFYIWNSRIMADVARVLGNAADAERFGKLEKEITATYNQKYFNPATGNYLSGTQMDNAFPLFLNVIPEAQKSKVLKNLVDDIEVANRTHLTTGVLGTKYMPEALARLGKADLVWQLINQKTYPGWSQMMDKYTTVCEFWTLKQSKNHVMMGSIDAWFYKYLAGIQMDENHPGWSQFWIRPEFPEGLDYADAQTETIKGTISSGWKRSSGELVLTVEIPFNCTAILEFRGGKSDRITEGGKPVSSQEGVDYLGYDGGKHQISVKSGKYQFKCTSL